VSGIRSFSGNGKDQITDDKESEHEEIPPRGKRKAWGLANKPQMGVSLFSAKGAKSRSPAYIHLVDMEHDGERLMLWFGHMTVKIVGKGLEPLVEGCSGRSSITSRRSMGRMLRPGARRIGSKVSR
jgi:hypothetical protein